jgi:uncharacterized protein
MSARLDLGVWSLENGLADALVTGLGEVWVLALAAGYVCLLALGYQRPRWARVLGSLAPVGRMALTNYVAQSAFMMLLFYGVGLGLLGQVGATFCLVASLVLFALQVVCSSWWLHRYRFGPLEWLWRSLTYARMQPLRAERAPVPEGAVTHHQTKS